MGTIEIFPDLLIKESGPKTLVGAASALVALNDASDASYVRAAGATPPGYSATFRMGALAGIPAGSVITRMQLKMRYSHFQKAPSAREIVQPVSILIGKQSGSTHSYYGFTMGESVPSFSTSTAVQSWTGPYRASTYDGKSYLDALLYKPGARVYASMQVSRQWAWSLARMYSLSVLVHYNEPPTGTISEPSGTEVVSRPTFVVDFVDPDNDPMAFAEYTIYDEATTLLSGFSPEIPNFDVNQATFKPKYYAFAWGDVREHTPQKAFGVDGNYVAYWRGFQGQMAGYNLHTGWLSSAFVLDTEGPAAPLVDATYDANTNGILVSATNRDNLLPWAHSSAEANPGLGIAGGWAIGANYTLDISNAQASHGSNSFRMTKSVSTGSMTFSGPAASGTDYGVATKVGRTYQARAKFRAATTGRLCRVGLSFYTAAGAIIGSITYGSTVTDTNAGFTEATYSQAAPTNAAFARMHVDIASVPVAEVHYVDQLAIMPGSLAWNRGGYGDDPDRAVYIQRSLDAGTTWADIPQSVTVLDKYGDATYADYEVPSGATASYQARAEGENEDGDLMIGDWSTADTAVMPVFDSWWLRDLTDPTLSMRIHVADYAGDMPVPGTSGYPLGSVSAVFSHDGLKKGTRKMRLFTLSKVAWDALMALVSTGRTLLLQDTLGEQEYVQVTNVSFTRLRAAAVGAEAAAGNVVRHGHELEIEIMVVEPPIARDLL